MRRTALVYCLAHPFPHAQRPWGVPFVAISPETNNSSATARLTAPTVGRCDTHWSAGEIDPIVAARNTNIFFKDFKHSCAPSERDGACGTHDRPDRFPSNGLHSARMRRHICVLIVWLQLLGLAQAACPACPLAEQQQQQQLQQQQITIGVPAACSLVFARSGPPARAAGAASNANLQQQQLSVVGAQNISLGRPVAVELLGQAAGGQNSASGVVLLAPGEGSVKTSCFMPSCTAYVDPAAPSPGHACSHTHTTRLTLLGWGPGVRPSKPNGIGSHRKTQRHWIPLTSTCAAAAAADTIMLHACVPACLQGACCCCRTCCCST